MSSCTWGVIGVAEEFNRLLADAVREMSLERDTAGTLDRAVRMTTDLITSSDYAGISLVRSGGIDTPAASEEQLRQADEYQNAVLHRTSSHQNMKLHQVARQLVRTGKLPGRRR